MDLAPVVLGSPKVSPDDGGEDVPPKEAIELDAAYEAKFEKALAHDLTFVDTLIDSQAASSTTAVTKASSATEVQAASSATKVRSNNNTASSATEVRAARGRRTKIRTRRTRIRRTRKTKRTRRSRAAARMMMMMSRRETAPSQRRPAVTPEPTASRAGSRSRVAGKVAHLRRRQGRTLLGSWRPRQVEALGRPSAMDPGRAARPRPDDEEGPRGQEFGGPRDEGALKKRSTARLERHLLLALLAGAASTGEATGVVVKWQGSLAETATADTAMLMTPWWLGWAVAMVLTLIFVMKMMMESFVIQRRVTTRTVATQSQTTYRVSQAGVGRFTPLVESGCGAWPET